MENPESHSPPLSPRMMHSYNNHTNIPWNMTQYSVPALNFDQKHIVQQRAFASQKKGVKVNDFYVTRKGFYMNYDLSQAKGVPSSGTPPPMQWCISIRNPGIAPRPSFRETNSRRQDSQKSIQSMIGWKWSSKRGQSPVLACTDYKNPSMNRGK